MDQQYQLAYAREKVMEVLTADQVFGMSVLDVGCGTGTLLLELGRRYAHLLLDLKGIDLSTKMIEQARIKAKTQGTNIQLSVGDVDELPMLFEEGTFDRVVCSSSFHYFPEPVKSLKSMYNVLKFKGKICIADVAYEGPVGWWQRLRERFSAEDLVNWYTKEEYQTMFSIAGLKDISVNLYTERIAGLIPIRLPMVVVCALKERGD
ncbi:class I SAM-dependent methyltransferase [Dehalococcoidia bacterium]|nr:class I SAM-dependent methyltransferase [Dehalococcoidia bacterium]